MTRDPEFQARIDASVAEGAAQGAVLAVRTMRAGLLRGRATHVEHAYPQRLIECAASLPSQHEGALHRAAEYLRKAERALHDAELLLAITLDNLDGEAASAARRGEADGSH